MTVNTSSSTITYVADGATTLWSFSYAVLASTDIQVAITDPNGIITQQPTNAYTVALNPPIAPDPTSVGGNVTFPLTGPPLAIGNSITITRIVPGVQPTSISNQSVIYPPVIEQALDRLTMVDQQSGDQLKRAIRVPVGDPFPPDLPPAALRTNQQAVFDSNGNMTAGGAVIGTIISPVMTPVVTAPTLPLARTAMGVPPIDSPIFTGNPQAPTPPPTDNDTSIATTAFVQTVGATLGVLIPSGTMMLFQQTAAPTGWTKVVTHNDKSLRVVNGAVGSGGFQPFSTVFGRVATDLFTLTQAEMPFHGHAVSDPTHAHVVFDPGHDHEEITVNNNTTSAGAWPKGVGDSTGTSLSGQNTQASVTGIAIGGAATGVSLFGAGSSGAHNHAMDIRVQYVDVIIAQKT